MALDDPEKLVKEIEEVHGLAVVGPQDTIRIKCYDPELNQWFWITSVDEFIFSDLEGVSHVITLNLRRQS